MTLERDRLVRVQRDRDALEEEVARRNEELRHAEDRLQFMLKAGRFGTWTLNLAEGRLLASEVCKLNFGRDPAKQFSYEDLLASIHPDDRERMQTTVAASIERRIDYDIEYRVVVPSGEVRWVEIRGQTSYRKDGAPFSMAGVSIDITDRKRNEEHRALLAGELKHRVKNSMATMQSIAHQTLRLSGNLEEARASLDSRLASLGQAHDLLTRDNWHGAALGDVVASAVSPFQSQGGTRFAIGGPQIMISPRAALAFAMALHELATNAVKYGALSVDGGRVLIKWEVTGAEEKAHLSLKWEELGGPVVATPLRMGFGSRMVEKMLSAEISGNAFIRYPPQGVICMIEAPVAALHTT